MAYKCTAGTGVSAGRGYRCNSTFLSTDKSESGGRFEVDLKLSTREGSKTLLLCLMFSHSNKYSEPPKDTFTSREKLAFFLSTGHFYNISV